MIESVAMRRIAFFGFAAILIAGCHRKIALVDPSTPLIPPHEEQYRLGVSAFREYTPDGYLRAIDHFQNAATRVPNRCDFGAAMAEAYLFLAYEQRLNQEDFQPALEKGSGILWDYQAGGADGAICPAGLPSILRLEAFTGLSDFGTTRDRLQLATSQLEQAIRAEPESAMNWYVRWRLNPTTYQKQTAILEAADRGPDEAAILYELGNYHLVKGEFKEARAAFERALRQSPKHFRSLIGLAQALSAVDDAEDVEHLYQQAVDLAPNFLEGRILLGDYYTGIEEPEKAREQYEAAQLANSRYAVAPLRLGISWIQAAEFDLAQKHFNRVLELLPSNFEAYYYLGNVAMARGDLANARSMYEESLKFVLNFPDAVYALGTIEYREGHTDRALEKFERVLQQNRQHADAYFSRAGIRMQRRQFVGAIEDYQRAIGIYDRQIGNLLKSIEDFENRGLTRKAESERKAKERVESLHERARTLKMRAEDENLKAMKP